MQELSSSQGSSVFLDLFLETQFMRPTRVYGEIGIKWQNKTLPLENTCSVVQKDLGHALSLSTYSLVLQTVKPSQKSKHVGLSVSM